MEYNKVNLYQELMNDVRLRDEVAMDVLKNRLLVKYYINQAELIAIQFRKMLEIIAFGSLIGNKEITKDFDEKYGKHWNAKEILRQLTRFDADLYPKPYIIGPPRIHNGENIIQQLPVDEKKYLTLDKWYKLYDLTSDFIHQPNPHNKKRPVADMVDTAFFWREQIRHLLQKHSLMLYSKTERIDCQISNNKRPIVYLMVDHGPSPFDRN